MLLGSQSHHRRHWGKIDAAIKALALNGSKRMAEIGNGALPHFEIEIFFYHILAQFHQFEWQQVFRRSQVNVEVITSLPAKRDREMNATK